MAHEKKLYTVTDLGPGDGGKGGVVHKITHMRRPHTILKVGGAQGSHGVTTSGGDRFAFSQFGCGTFEGVRTHIASRMVASPEGILNEGNLLCYGNGIRDVFGLLTVDEDVVCATPLHAVASHLKEFSWGNNPRGTIGSGVGEAYRYAHLHPGLTIRARDLASPHLEEMLVAVRAQIWEDMYALTIGTEFLPADRPEVDKEMALLQDDQFLAFIAERFREVAKQVRIVDNDYLRREILARDGVIIVESSHGILTDCYRGFYPHTSAIRTLPCFTHAMLRDAGYDGDIVNIAVSRAYQVRHGAGPMPTADPSMNDQLLPGSHKEENRYQGKVRVGPLDLVLLRYAIACAGGATAFDGLAITWFDQIQRNGAWKFCDRYDGADDLAYFTPTGELQVRDGADMMQCRYQEQLGRRLQQCRPQVNEMPIALDMDRDQLFDLCAEVLCEKLGVNVRMVSFGPTERDKICK